MALITLLDGGMGQELVARSGDEPTPLWATRVMIDHPGLVKAVGDEQRLGRVEDLVPFGLVRSFIAFSRHGLAFLRRSGSEVQQNRVDEARALVNLKSERSFSDRRKRERAR